MVVHCKILKNCYVVLNTSQRVFPNKKKVLGFHMWGDSKYFKNLISSIEIRRKTLFKN